MEIKCPFCKKNMVIVLDTPLCIKCDWDVIEEINSDIKSRMEVEKK